MEARMTAAVLVLGAGILLGVLGTLVAARRRTAGPAARIPTRRILFPFVGNSLSEAALDAALRIARAENAAVVPAYLVTVPCILDLTTAVPNECGAAFELFEAIEQRATHVSVRNAPGEVLVLRPADQRRLATAYA
jgi:hypothetical protein